MQRLYAEKGNKIIETDPMYSDSLATITEKGILFKRYGLLGGDRFVPIDEIEKNIVKKPTIWNGRWHMHGTGNFRTWFPEDNNRPKRDIIFVAYIRNKWGRIGFTVEDSPRVVSILQEKGIVDNTADTILAETAELRSQSMIKPDRN